VGSDMRWRPIAEAPRDGTRILGFCPGSRVEIYQWYNCRFHVRPIPYWAIPGTTITWSRTHQPTLWMLLPPAPEEE
jgi:hypothetical protein